MSRDKIQQGEEVAGALPAHDTMIRLLEGQLLSHKGTWRLRRHDLRLGKRPPKHPIHKINVPMPEKKLYLFMKLEHREHLEELYHDGRVFMSPIASHRQGEANTERTDPNEGAETVFPINNASLYKLNSGPEKPPIKVAYGTRGTARQFSSAIDGINIYSVLHIPLPLGVNLNLGETIDERVREGFGDTVVVIGNPAEFIRRMKRELRKKGLASCHGVVKYSALEKGCSVVGPFRKDVSYSHQREFRFVARQNPENNIPGPLVVSIGEISNFALIIPSNKLDTLVVRGEQNTLRC